MLFYGPSGQISDCIFPFPFLSVYTSHFGAINPSNMLLKKSSRSLVLLHQRVEPVWHAQQKLLAGTEPDSQIMPGPKQQPTSLIYGYMMGYVVQFESIWYDIFGFVQKRAPHLVAISRAETICFRWLNCLQKAVVLVANLSIAFQESFGFLQSNDGEYLTVMRQTHGGVVAQRHHLLEMLTSTFKPARLTQTRCWTAHFTCSAPVHVQTGRVNLHQTWQWKQTFKGTLAYTIVINFRHGYIQWSIFHTCLITKRHAVDHLRHEHWRKLRYIHANTSFLDQLISIIHWLNHVKADFFDVESHHFGRSNSSPMAFLTACDFISGGLVVGLVKTSGRSPWWANPCASPACPRAWRGPTRRWNCAAPRCLERHPRPGWLCTSSAENGPVKRPVKRRHGEIWGDSY